MVFFLHLSITCAEPFAGAIPKADPKGNPDVFGVCIYLETGNAEGVSCCTMSCLTGLRKGGRPVPGQQLNIFRCIMTCTHSLSQITNKGANLCTVFCFLGPTCVADIGRAWLRGVLPPLPPKGPFCSADE